MSVFRAARPFQADSLVIANVRLADRGGTAAPECRIYLTNTESIR